MEISILLLGVAQTSSPQTWIVVAGLATGQSLGAFVVGEPQVSLEERDIVWYVEEFALNDPYSEGRAEEIAQRLDGYAAQLSRLLRPAVSRALRASGGGVGSLSLRLHVQALQGHANIHSIKWELLERQVSCLELNANSVFVIRQVSPTTRPSSSTAQRPKQNILLVSARHALQDPIPYRIISLPVWNIAEAARREEVNVELYFSRPGTWGTLKRTLRDRPIGFFSIAHFDLHGVRLRDRSFCFRFSPSYYNAQVPEDVPVDEVARVLSEYGVKAVVLNACNSGNQPVDPILRSAAHILVSQGVFEVVVMSHSVMKSTAVDFMTAFYEKLFLEGSTIAGAVQHGRNYLRNHATKEGRFSLLVRVHDDFVPVFYRSEHSPGGLFEHHNNLPGPEIAGPSSRRGSDDKQPSSGVQLLGRENDLLSIESALCENAIVKVVGDHGVGKTCFANRLLRWWRETGFIDHAFAIDCSDLSTSLIETLIHQINGDTFHGTRGSQKRVLVCVDNFNIRKAGQGSNQRLQWKTFRDYVTRLKTHCPRSTWLLLGRFSETASAANDIIPVAEYFLKGLKEDEAAQLLRRGFECDGMKLPSTREFNEQMEEFTDLQDGNPLAMELLGSFEPFFGSFLALTLALKFWVPPLVYLGLDSALKRDNWMMSSPSAERSLEYLNESSNTLHEFKCLIDTLEQRSKLALQIAMSLSACQRVIPFDLRDWVTWLFQSGGMLSNQSEAEEASLGTVEAGTSSKSPEHPPEPAVRCVSWVLEQLVDFGFIYLASQTPGSSVPKYYEVHPLLPHLLRYEMVKRSNNPSTEVACVKLHQLPSMLWHLYEFRISSLIELTNGTQDASGVPVEVRKFFEAEHINIYNAVEACIQQPEFGYRTMNVLGILLSEAVTELSSMWARAQTRLLDCVLRGLEHLYQIQHYRSALAREETADALGQIVVLAWWRGNTLLAAAEYAAAHENAKRALLMLEDLMPSVLDRRNLGALSFSLRCQAAFVASSSGLTDALLQLLSEGRPAGLEKNVAYIWAASRYLIQTRYLMSEGDAVGGPDAVSFKYLAKLYAHAFRGSELTGVEFPNHQDVLRDLEDPSLDEECWSTKLRPAISSAFVKVGRCFLFEAASSLLREAEMLKTDKRQHRESLQIALQVARRTHDLKAEASSLDELFTLAAGEDVRAAMRIHEELVNLEQDLEAAGQDWRGTGAAELNCSIGTLLIRPTDSGPASGHLYSEARPYFERGIQGTYEAMNGTKAKMKDLRMLYRGNMGLSRCGRSAGDRAEYVSNAVRAIQVDLFLSEHGVSAEWGDGAAMRWVLEEFHQSVQTHTIPDFIIQVAAGVIWDAAEVLHFLIQCQMHAKTLLEGNSRAALEETQRLFFGPSQVDETRLKYWRHGQQGEWTLEAPKLRKSFAAMSYLWIVSVAAFGAFWVWKRRE